MPLTQSKTNPHEHFNRAVGYSCGSTPPNVNLFSRSPWAVDTWTRTTWGQMDVKAFYKVNGYLPLRPYKREGVQKSISVGSCNFSTNPDGVGCVSWRECTVDWKVFGSFAPYTDISFRSASKTDPMFVSLRNKALARLNDKVKNMDAGLGETLGEGRKTLDMCVDTVKRLTAAAMDVRNFKFKSAARRLRIGVPKGVSRRYGFSTNWLAYRYGWMPLYLNTYGTMKALWDHYNRPQIRIVNAAEKAEVYDSSRSRTYVDERYLDSSSVARNPDPATVSWKVDRTGRAMYLVRAGYVFEYTNPNLATLTSLGLADPLGVAWELVPFSFFVDWFLNVGEVLSQLTNFNGKELKGHYITYYFHHMVSSRSKPYGILPVGPTRAYASFTQSPSSCWEKRYWLERETFTTLQVVQLQFHNGLNPTRLVDALTLMRQLFK